MSPQACEKRQKNIREDKLIRISRRTWDRLRKLRVQMSVEKGEPVASFNDAVDALIDAYGKQPS